MGKAARKLSGAALAEWNAKHPRGPDGRYIKAGSIQGLVGSARAKLGLPKPVAASSHAPSVQAAPPRAAIPGSARGMTAPRLAPGEYRNPAQIKADAAAYRVREQAKIDELLATRQEYVDAGRRKENKPLNPLKIIDDEIARRRSNMEDAERRVTPFGQSGILPATDAQRAGMAAEKVPAATPRQARTRLSTPALAGSAKPAQAKPQGPRKGAAAKLKTPQPPLTTGRVSGARSASRLEVPNNGADQGFQHRDSFLGNLWEGLGDDRTMDVDGRALGNLVYRMSYDITNGTRTTNDAIAELKQLQQRVPLGSVAHREIGETLAKMDAPDRDIPALPAGTPPQLRQLMADLNEIALVRRGYHDSPDPSRLFHETDELADLVEAWMGGRLGAVRFKQQLQQLLFGRRHESQEGFIEIRTAHDKAMRDFDVWRRTAG